MHSTPETTSWYKQKKWPESICFCASSTIEKTLNGVTRGRVVIYVGRIIVHGAIGYLGWSQTEPPPLPWCLPVSLFNARDNKWITQRHWSLYRILLVLVSLRTLGTTGIRSGTLWYWGRLIQKSVSLRAKQILVQSKSSLYKQRSWLISEIAPTSLEVNEKWLQIHHVMAMARFVRRGSNFNKMIGRGSVWFSTKNPTCQNDHQTRGYNSFIYVKGLTGSQSV